MNKLSIIHKILLYMHSYRANAVAFFYNFQKLQFFHVEASGA